MKAITTTDFYKVDHIRQYPKGATKVYSNFTPRSAKLFNGSSEYDDKIVNFGLQITIKDYLINFWNKTFFNRPRSEVIQEYSNRMINSIGKVKITQWEELYDLGYLPIIIKALPEGRRSPIKVPVFTITETDPRFFWLTNYLETALSTESWKAFTMATTAFEFRRIFEKYAKLTGSSKEFVKFQGHDFSMRGLGNRVEAFTNNIAHLTCFTGTDTIPSIDGAEKFYNADSSKELIGTSVYASEHSTITMNIAYYISQRTKGILEIASVLPEKADEWQTDSWKSDWQMDLNGAIKDGYKYLHTINDDCYYEIIDESSVKSVTQEFAQERSNLRLDDINSRQIAELEVIKYMITEIYPTGVYSHVSDSYDYWHTISVTAKKLKDIINAREVNDIGLAKVVFRPDSGDPESIICGLKIANFSKEQLEEIEKENDLTHEKLVNYANNIFNRSYYDGFYFDNIAFNWQGEELSDEEVKGSLVILDEIFGSTINEKGYKVINPRVGLIYGDSITIIKQESILKRMMEMGFASENIVLGIGSFSYQYMTRDTLGFAMKATYGEVQGKHIEIFKDPKTDSGTKKSAKGLLCVTLDEKDNYILTDQVDKETESKGELQVVFKNGKLYNETSLQEIRDRIDSEFE